MKKHYEELILIVDKPVLSKKNILDIIVEQRAANPTIVINIYPYHLFCINIPKVSAIPKHKLITQEEAQEFLGREYLQPQDLMQISASDPRWSGWEEDRETLCKLSGPQRQLCTLLLSALSPSPKFESRV